MLNDEIENEIQLKRQHKNSLESTNQSHDPGHKIRITSLNKNL
jgi:hypothetical protein